mmetsp:Transcript_30010/g.90210  ORF Transcript_30010/g.90210 Transcript_30010/m.90210 type:complete len:275 (+) Transcript_30010:384-1208(+)
MSSDMLLERTCFQDVDGPCMHGSRRRRGCDVDIPWAGADVASRNRPPTLPASACPPAAQAPRRAGLSASGGCCGARFRASTPRRSNEFRRPSFEKGRSDASTAARARRSARGRLALLVAARGLVVQRSAAASSQLCFALLLGILKLTLVPLSSAGARRRWSCASSAARPTAEEVPVPQEALPKSCAAIDEPCGTPCFNTGADSKSEKSARTRSATSIVRGARARRPTGTELSRPPAFPRRARAARRPTRTRTRGATTRDGRRTLTSELSTRGDS